MNIDMPRRYLAYGVAAGIVVGAAYALSPVTVLFAGIVILLWRWAGDGGLHHLLHATRDDSDGFENSSGQRISCGSIHRGAK